MWYCVWSHNKLLLILSCIGFLFVCRFFCISIRSCIGGFSEDRWIMAVADLTTIWYTWLQIPWIPWIPSILRNPWIPWNLWIPWTPGNELTIQKTKILVFMKNMDLTGKYYHKVRFFMKTCYLRVVLAVILVSAVCRFNTRNTLSLRKLFSRRNNNFQVLWFFRISAAPASRAYRKHSHASGLPKPIPLGIPRPFFRQKSIGFVCSFGYLELSISASCK